MGLLSRILTAPLKIAVDILEEVEEVITGEEEDK
jgi:hypothetical protein